MSDNPARVSFSFHLGCIGTIEADKQFSLYIARILDYLGKNQDMVKYRVKMYREQLKHINVIHNEMMFMETIIAGSKAEGLTSVYESDRDSMCVFLDVVCAENVRPLVHRKITAVFQTETHDSYAGYTKLKRVNYIGMILCSLIKDSLVQDERGDKYLSSDAFITLLSQEMFENNPEFANRYERSGPSLPISQRNGHVHEDKVPAFRCLCPTLLHLFLTRQRPYSRPSVNELRDISVMDAHVVPVGHKGSETSHLEWRICFTKAELYLVQRLNDTGTKLYILLKMISKLDRFPLKDITSYIMKNIVLWLYELYPTDEFIEQLLTYQLLKALTFLKKCVECNYLPSYMIPQRNLLADRLDPAQRQVITTFLSTLIQERGYLLLRCEKLRNGMTILYRKPDMADEFGKGRDLAEKLVLVCENMKYKKMATTGLSLEKVVALLQTDRNYLKMQKIIVIITVYPILIHLKRQGYSFETFSNLVNAEVRRWLS